MLRNAKSADFDQIIDINKEWEHFLAPLPKSRLESLDAECEYHKVIEQDDKVVAFLLAFIEGAEYDSPNYKWFSQKHDRFTYIDRIAVKGEYQNKGLGKQMYSDLMEYAKLSERHFLTCEYNLTPPNRNSRIFHSRMGFAEVGQQVLGGGKVVSLQSINLRKAANG